MEGARACEASFGPDDHTIPRRIREADAELARLGRCEAQLKLRIGELLDALFERGGHHELGFSSFEAYVVERCEHSRSWGRATRAFAKRLRERELHRIRQAILAGRLGWSMAELLSRHATRESEAELLAAASSGTVREMQAKLTAKRKAPKPEVNDETSKVRPTHSVSETELLMLGASRMLVEYLVGARVGDEAFVDALLGEAQSTLEGSGTELSEPAREGNPAELSEPAIDFAALEALSTLHAAKTPPPQRPMEPRFAPPIAHETVVDEPLPTTLRGLDRQIVRCCRELARRNIEIGRLMRTVLVRGAWRALGYDSLAQYAAERVGLSLSSLEHRMTLARRVARYPGIRRAVDDGSIGYEAALIVSRVVGGGASDQLVEAWIDRAKKRTVKHLREESDAVLYAVGLDPSVDRSPPSEEDLEAVFDFERAVQTGELLRPYVLAAQAPQTFVTFATGESASKRCSLRLTIPVDVHVHWQKIEEQFRARAGSGASFVSFLCVNLWRVWLPFLETWDEKWKALYQRDRHRCTSPVCERHDVTPHHVVFKQHGGGDELANMTSACAFCHLEGIHRGRLRVDGTASRRRWVIGRDPVLVVRGREKVAVAG